MSDLNRAMIIGRLGRDPEIRYSADGKAIASFSLATTDKWRDKQSGEIREKTEWHRIVAFGRLGEICGEYLSKGKQVFIEGRLRTRSWEKDGITRYTTEIEAVNMQMLGVRSEGEGGRAGGNFASDSGGRASSYSSGANAYSNNLNDGGRAAYPSTPGRQTNNAPDQGYPEPTYNEPIDDDIPF